MTDEQYSVGIEIDAELLQKSLNRIDAITKSTVNNLANSIDKVTQKLGGNIGADKFAASLAQIAIKAKGLKGAEKDIENIAKAVGVSSSAIVEAYNKLEKQSTNELKKGASDREKVLKEEQKTRKAIEQNMVQDSLKAERDREKALREEQNIRRKVAQESSRIESNAAKERERVLKEEQNIRSAILKKQEQDEKSSQARRKQLNEKRINGAGTLGTSMTIGGTAMLAGLALSVAKMATFEQAMAKVGAKADATSSQLKALKSSALDLTKYGFTTDKIVEMQDTLASMGFDSSKIIASQKAIATAARASGSDLNDTASMIAKTLTVYGMSADKSMHVADVLAKADIKSAANLQTMYYAMNYAAAPAKTLNISLEELSGSIMMLANSGQRAETIGTSLRSGFIQLAKNSDKLKTIGINVQKSNGDMKSMADILDMLKTKIGNLAPSDKIKVLSKIFPKTAVSAWINLIDQGGGVLRQYTKDLENCNGSSEKLAKTIQDNLLGDTQKLQGDFDKLSITGGGSLAPTLRGLVQGADSLVNALNSTNPAFTSFVTGTTAGLGVTLTLTGAFLGLVSAAGTLSTAFAAIGFTSLLNPLSAAIVLIGVATGATMSFISANNQFKAKLDELVPSQETFNAEMSNQRLSMMENVSAAGGLINQFGNLAKSHKTMQDRVSDLYLLQTKLKSQFPQVADQMSPLISQYRNGKISVDKLIASLRVMIVTAALATQRLALVSKMNTLVNQKKAYEAVNMSNLMNFSGNAGAKFVSGMKNNAKNLYKSARKGDVRGVIDSALKLNPNVGILDAYEAQKKERQNNINRMNKGIKRIQKEIDKTYSAGTKDNPSLNAQLSLLAKLGQVGNNSSGNSSGGNGGGNDNHHYQSLRNAGLNDFVNGKDKTHRARKKKKSKTKKGKAAMTPYEADIAAYEGELGKETEIASQNGEEITNAKKLELFKKYVHQEDAIQNTHLKQKDDYNKRLGALTKAAKSTMLQDALVGFEKNTENDTARQKYDKYVAITDSLQKETVLYKKQLDQIAKTKKDLLEKAIDEDYTIETDNIDKLYNLYKISTSQKYQLELDAINKKVAAYKDIDVKKFADAEKEKTEILKKQLDYQYDLSEDVIQKETEARQFQIDLNRDSINESYNLGQITNAQKLQALKGELAKEYDANKNNILSINNLIKSQILAISPNLDSTQLNNALEDNSTYKKNKEDLIKLDRDYQKNVLDIDRQIYEDRTQYFRDFKSSIGDSYQSMLSDLLQGNSTITDAFQSLLNNLNKSFSDMLSKWITDWTIAWGKQLFSNGSSSGIMTSLTNLFSKPSAGNSQSATTNTTGNSLNMATQLAVGSTKGTSSIFGNISSGWSKMLTGMKNHQGLFITGALGAWGMLAQGSASKWALMASAAYAAIRYMFVAFRNAKAKEAWVDAFSAASGAWANAMSTYPFPVNLAMGAASAAAAFAFPAAKAAAITAMSFDVGTMSVPQDMLANIHKGEVIVPEKFSDKARRVLEGGSTNTNNSNTQSSANNINLHYNISMIDQSGAEEFIQKHSEYTAKTLGKIFTTGNVTRKTIR